MARLRHTDWPDRLWIVRHGQSAGNVARDRAELAAHHLIDLETRDADTPLSDLGREQARALGGWFARLPPDMQPTTLMSSPFVRSRQTMEAVARALGTPDDDVLVDERLRLRSVTEVLRRDYVGERVLIVAHQVIVNCFRYLLECMDEAQILGIDRQADVPNCSVTTYAMDRDAPDPRFRLEVANMELPLLEAGAPVTQAADVPAGPR